MHDLFHFETRLVLIKCLKIIAKYQYLDVLIIRVDFAKILSYQYFIVLLFSTPWPVAEWPTRRVEKWRIVAQKGAGFKIIVR